MSAGPANAPDVAAADPFAVLGIAPTGNLAAVKRAYFAALKLHPPHADAAGFRRVRAAYERLLAPGVLAMFAWTATIDRAAALRELDERLAGRLAPRRDTIARADSGSLARAALERAVADASWSALVAAFAPTER